MTSTTLCVEKGSDQMRATFVASGLARFVFSQIGSPPQVDVQIKDVGGAFLLQTTATKAEIVNVARKRWLPQLLPAIVKKLTPTEQKRLDQGVPLEHLHRRYVPAGFPSSDIIDYPTERDRWRATAGSSQELPVGASAPDSRLPLWAHLCSHFGLGVNMTRTYPLLVHLWFAHQGKWAARLCELILDHYSASFSDQPKSWEDSWRQEIKPHLNLSELKQFNWNGNKTRVRALALVSPPTIQGSNTAIAGQRPTNETLDLFWVEMYLAYAGWLTIALPYYWQRTRQSKKDVATYYPVPADMAFSELETVMRLVRSDPDIQALYNHAARFPRVYTEVWNTLLFFKAAYSALDKRSDDPARDSVAGLASCYYKDISTHVPLEENCFAARLPNGSDQSNAAQLVSLLIESLTAVRAAPFKPADVNLDTQHLIERVRAYLLTPTAKNWITFGLAYGQHCFHQMRSVWYVRTLTQTDWERQLMMHTPSSFTEILEDSGFQAIAAAIHFATTGLVWRTQRPQNPQPSMFKVRYGLDRDLLEHARDSAQFIGALAEFLRTYAWERERLRVHNVHNEHWPPEVTDEHFYRVVALVDQYGSELVARMLITSGLLRR